MALPLRREAGKEPGLDCEETAQFRIARRQTGPEDCAARSLGLTRDVWYACEQLSIPLLPSMSVDIRRSAASHVLSLPPMPAIAVGQMGRRKVECGIHIEARPLGNGETELHNAVLIGSSYTLNRAHRGGRAPLLCRSGAVLECPHPSQWHRLDVRYGVS